MTTENNFTLDEVRRFWDKTAPIYEKENQKVFSVHNQRFVEALKHLTINANDKILNIWSRTGTLIPFLRQKSQVAVIENLEVSPVMMAIAQKRFPAERFSLTDLQKLNFPDNLFDSIISLETLEHCPRPLDFLQEIFRVLKPQGRLILSCPPASCEPAYALYTFFRLGHGEGPHKFLSSPTVKKMLALCGFEILLHKSTLLIPLGPSFLKQLGEKLIERYQNTFLKELGIRQFYICQKKTYGQTT